MSVKQTQFGSLDYSDENEFNARKRIVDLLKSTPIPDDELLANLGLYLNSKNLSRILALNNLYEKIIDTMGIIVDFGTRWGQNMAVWTALRGIYEPYNRHRKIIGFDTFEGFPSLHQNDGKSVLMKNGNLSLPENYDKYLEIILTEQENDNPINHIKKFEIIKGNAVETTEKYFKENPHSIISLAYFDFDIYEPTLKCLNVIKSHIIKGSVIAFDELNDEDSPGETVALKEIFELNNIKLKKYRYASRMSYFIVE